MRRGVDGEVWIWGTSLVDCPSWCPLPLQFLLIFSNRLKVRRYNDSTKRWLSDGWLWLGETCISDDVMVSVCIKVSGGKVEEESASTGGKQVEDDVNCTCVDGYFLLTLLSTLIWDRTSDARIERSGWCYVPLFLSVLYSRQLTVEMCVRCAFDLRTGGGGDEGLLLLFFSSPTGSSQMMMTINFRRLYFNKGGEKRSCVNFSLLFFQGISFSPFHNFLKIDKEQASYEGKERKGIVNQNVLLTSHSWRRDLTKNNITIWSDLISFSS